MATPSPQLPTPKRSHHIHYIICSLYHTTACSNTQRNRRLFVIQKVPAAPTQINKVIHFFPIHNSFQSQVSLVLTIEKIYCLESVAVHAKEHNVRIYSHSHSQQALVKETLFQLNIITLEIIDISISNIQDHSLAR